MKFKKILKILLIILASLLILLISLNVINFLTAREKAETAVAADLITYGTMSKGVLKEIQIQFSSFNEFYIEKDWDLFEHHINVYGVIESQNKNEYSFNTCVYVNAFTGETYCGVIYYNGD